MNRREFLTSTTALAASAVLPAPVAAKYQATEFMMVTQISMPPDAVMRLAASIRATKEVVAANVLNRAFFAEVLRPSLEKAWAEHYNREPL